MKELVIRNLGGLGFCALCLAALLPTQSLAQQPVNSLPDLETRVRPGDAVRVIDMNGQEIDGRLQGVSADSVSLTVDGGVREFGYQPCVECG